MPKPNTPTDKFAGYKLVPLYKRHKSWPRAQENLIENTYYRVRLESPTRLSEMVTIMPDGLFVAWGNCGKCKNPVFMCDCTTGFYQPQSISWIRATYEHPEWPAQRIRDYSEWYDPFMRKTDTPSPDSRRNLYQPPVDRKRPKAKSTPPPVDVTPPPTDTVDELANTDLEKLDLGALGEAAKKSAKSNLRKTRSIIRRKSKGKE